MTIDIVGQRDVSPARPNVPSHPSSNSFQRQELPGVGQTSPQAVAAGMHTPSDIKQAVQDLNNYVQSLKRDLHFTIDEESGETVVMVTNSDSGEVIRQIPSKEVLAIAHSLEKAQGLLFSTKA